MAGRAHAAGYRMATTLFGTERPDVRLVAIGDTNAAVADDTAKRYGYERAEYDWRAIAEAPDVDARQRRGRQPSAPRDRRGIARRGQACAVREAAGRFAGRRRGDGRRGRAQSTASPPSATPTAGRPPSSRSGVNSPRAHWANSVHFNGRYWCDYALDPTVADHVALPRRTRHRRTGRRRQPPDRHVGVRLCGPIAEVSGAVFATLID